MNLKLLQEPMLYTFLERVDHDIAEETRREGCPCGGVLHSARYPRKPRGGLESLKWDSRWSFCCAAEGCRHRRTPPSVRFLGRKVYLGVVVVLVAAMMHGPDGKRVGKLHEELGIDRRTLERWREWWLKTFVETKFWKAQRGQLMPPVDEEHLPLSLVERFQASAKGRLVDLMRFLSPITTTWAAVEVAF
ncbi:MAG: hypothetical protein ABIG68_10370 [Acidobacteriota bacterium]